jgi:hypothetical protein
MERVMTVQTASGAQRQLKLDGFPDRCPRCHTSLVPRTLAQVALSAEPTGGVEEAFQCTSRGCSGIFIGRYEYVNGTMKPQRFALTRVFPLEPQPPTVPDTVKALSPVFFETYSQALAAEGIGLTQLTGIGLRKALEFLVKDFALAEHPTESEEILRKTLAKCISGYLTDPTVREVAKRAAWLGNDETHYIRKWEDRDVGDLKVLIHLTMNGIDNTLLSRRYVAEMPE